MTMKPEALRLAEQLEDPVNAKLHLAPYIAAELRRLHALNSDLLEALKKISEIENQEWGADWEEIEEARDIADAAISQSTGDEMTETITLPRSIVEQAMEALGENGMPYHDDQVMAAFRAALEQPQVNSPEIPEGWKLVPVKPTEDMLAAVAWPGCAATDWEHMLAAAPQPPVVEQPQVEQEPVTRNGWVLREILFDNEEPVGHREPQPPRQPLTDKVIQELAEEGVFHANIFEIVRRIEEEHGIFKLRAHGIGGEA